MHLNQSLLSNRHETCRFTKRSESGYQRSAGRSLLDRWTVDQTVHPQWLKGFKGSVHSNYKNGFLTSSRFWAWRQFWLNLFGCWGTCLWYFWLSDFCLKLLFSLHVCGATRRSSGGIRRMRPLRNTDMFMHQWGRHSFLIAPDRSDVSVSSVDV